MSRLNVAIKTIVVLSVLLFSSVFLMSCGETSEQKKCVHDWGDWLHSKAATCEDKGERVRICSKCGYSSKETIQELGHTTKFGVCSRCNQQVGENKNDKQTYTATEISNQALKYVGEIKTYDRFGGELGLGTGFVYSQDGKIVTNYHVIEGATSAVFSIDGKNYEIKNVLAYDATIDLAVVQINAKFEEYAVLSTEKMDAGAVVYAMGSSRGMTNTFSQGIITYFDRVVDGVTHVQHDASITNGNSGGPLINEYGEVIGVNTWTLTESQNLNFAVSVKELDNLVFGTPKTLDELFKTTVKWISERDFWLYEDTNQFVLVFELKDEDKMPMTASGSVDIRIVNDEGETVYNKTRKFTADNWEGWIFNGTQEVNLATIYIDYDDITAGATPDGTAYITVYGEDFYFEEWSTYVNDLPYVSSVQWLSEQDFWLYEDTNQFVLNFLLSDTAGIPMTASGTVDIRIVNDNNETVYYATRNFTPYNWEIWIIGGTEELDLATIYIDYTDISEGLTSGGMVYFTVYGDGFYFEELSLPVYDLPLLPTTLYGPDLPMELNCYTYSGSILSKIQVTLIEYEVVYDDSLQIYVYCEKTYDNNSNSYSSYTESFTWKLCDSNGYILDRGTAYADDYVDVGDKFIISFYIWDCWEVGQSYSLVLAEND